MSRESCSFEQAWRLSGKHRQRLDRQPVAASVVYSRHVRERGYGSGNGNVRGGACTAEVDVGEAAKQRYGVGVAADVVDAVALVGSSAAVFAVGADVDVNVDACASVGVVQAAGAVAAESATRLTWDARPWWFVADRGRLCVLV